MQKLNVAYIPALDGLRGISILLVFIAHIGFENLVPGGLGVTLFFFISGYIITLVLIKEYSIISDVNLKLFYTGRILRLYPPLLFALALIIPYLIFIGYPLKTSEIFASLLYYENYYFFYIEHGHLTLSILWSLAVEEHFYLIFPLLFVRFYRQPKKLVIIFIVLIVIALILRLAGAAQYGYSSEVLERYCYLLTHTRFDSILYGCLAAVILKSSKARYYQKWLSNKKLFFIALSLQVVCLLIRDEVFRYSVRYTLQGMSLFIVIPAIINTSSYPKIGALLCNKILVAIGKVSYSIYLLHMIAISALIFIKNSGHLYLYFGACVIATAILACISYYGIERPIYRFRKQLQAAKMPAPAAGHVNATA